MGHVKDGVTPEQIKKMMDDETWMSANVAVKEGFADGILYENETDQKVMNFSYNKLCIQNSASQFAKNLLEFEKKNITEPQDTAEKEKILIEMDLLI